MDIAKIDKNFKDNAVITEKGRTYALPCAPFTIHGGIYEEEHGFVSIPQNIAKTVSPAVEWGSKCTSGIRLTFSSDSKNLTLEVETDLPIFMKNMTFIGSSGFSLTEKTVDGEVFIGTVTPPFGEIKNNPDAIVQLKSYSMTFNLEGGKIRDYILYFPLYSGVKRLKITVDKTSIVEEFFGYKKGVLPVMYYGSSITQGASASRPDNMYQSLVSGAFNVDYVNHGFSGNALGEFEMANFLAGEKCSVFVCDYDYNAPTAEHLKNTHERLFKIFRQKQKDTPVIFLTKPDKHEINGVDKERDERAEIIKTTYLNAKKSGDKNVYFIDSRTIFPPDAIEHVFCDGVHPNDLGMYFIAKAVIKKLKKILK